MYYQENYKRYIEVISKVLSKDISNWIDENKLFKLKLEQNEDIVIIESVTRPYKAIRLVYNTAVMIFKFDNGLLQPLSWQLGDLFEQVEDSKGNIDYNNLYWIVQEADRIFALLSKNKYNVIKTL